MPKISIQMYEHNRLSATLTLPVWIMRGGASVLAGVAGKEFSELVDLDALLDAAEDPQANGLLLELEDHEDGGRIRISVIPDKAPAR